VPGVAPVFLSQEGWVSMVLRGLSQGGRGLPDAPGRRAPGPTGHCSFLYDPFFTNRGLLADSSKDKTASSTLLGLLLHASLRVVRTTFQRLMDRVLRPHAAYAAAYLVIIRSTTWAEHEWRVGAVLESLRRARLTANPGKCAVGGRSGIWGTT